MTPPNIQEQVAIIKKATEAALKSHEAALNFLTKAGIIDLLQENSVVLPQHGQKK